MGIIDEDEYYLRKAGTVPFKWEIRPGVPKLARIEQKPNTTNHHSAPSTPRKLRPPPAGLHYRPSTEKDEDEEEEELRARSFSSAPRSRSDRHHHHHRRRSLGRAEAVSSTGCFPSPLMPRKKDQNNKRSTTHIRHNKAVPQQPKSMALPRSSFSTTSGSLSPSPSSSLSYHQRHPWSSPPRAISDVEWAGFGLF